MDIGEYQSFTETTATYRTSIREMLEGLSKSELVELLEQVYTTLGLVGEVGEMANKLKKVIRDKNGALDLGLKKDLGKELGDVAWYVAQCATNFEQDLGMILQENMHKLNDRKARNKLHGEGDNR